MSRRLGESTNRGSAWGSETSSLTGSGRLMAWQLTRAPVSAPCTAAPLPLPPPVTTATLPASDSGTQEDLYVVRRTLGQGCKCCWALLDGHHGLQVADAATPGRQPVERLFEVRI